jgi:hypothetical protein
MCLLISFVFCDSPGGRAGWSGGGVAERGDDGNEPGADREGDFQARGRAEAGEQGAEHGDAQDAAGLPEGGEGRTPSAASSSSTTAKANSARWCSMAACGNRMKARRHYQRTRNDAAL